MSGVLPSADVTAPAPAPAWRRLLDGETAERARDAVVAVAEALADPSAVPPLGAGPGLSRGHAGRALLFTYVADSLDEPRWREAAAGALDAAVEALAEQAVGAELFGGFTGVGWAFQHLAGRLFPATEAAGATAEIDEALSSLLGERWEGDFDLIAGLAGFGLYALEGLPQPPARQLLDRVVAELARRAERRGGGLTWFTPPRLVPPSQRDAAPEGYFNLGLAHGVPGAIVVLARAAGRGIPRAAEALAPAVDWLLGRERHDGNEAAFAHWELADPSSGERQESRLAWCYGDLGVAAALAVAGEAVGETAWSGAARRVARRAAERPARRSGVVDCGLCHGAAGVAHLFNRLAQATGDDLLADAARRWFRTTLELRRPGHGVAAFPSWEPSQGGWRDDPGLLTGAAGVALALVAAISPVEPEWDRALAISGAPAGAHPGRAA